MSGCGFLDIACMAGGALAPLFAFWDTLVAFWNTWWPVFLFDAGMLVGSILGPRIVIALNTIGFGWFLYDRFKPVPEPIETELPAKDKIPAPKKPKRPTIFDDLLKRK